MVEAVASTDCGLNCCAGVVGVPRFLNPAPPPFFFFPSLPLCVETTPSVLAAWPHQRGSRQLPGDRNPQCGPSGESRAAKRRMNVGKPDMKDFVQEQTDGESWSMHHSWCAWPVRSSKWGSGARVLDSPSPLDLAMAVQGLVPSVQHGIMRCWNRGVMATVLVAVICLGP